MDTIVNGGGFSKIDRDAGLDWYRCFKKSGLTQMLFFDYDVTRHPVIKPERKVMFIKKLDFFNKQREKLFSG